MNPIEMTDAEIAAGIAELRVVANRTLEKLGPVGETVLGLDRAAVVWAENYVEQERARRDPTQGVPEDLVHTLGAVVGECILAAARGAWVWDDLQNDWGISLAAGGRIFPMGKVWRQFTQGHAGGESIVVFYDIVVEYLAKGKLPVDGL